MTVTHPSRISKRRSPSSKRSSRSSRRATCALEQSLALYERGVQLSRFCHARLEEAERRIEILNERGELKPAPASLAAGRSRAADAVARESLAAFLDRARAQVDAALERYLPRPPGCPAIVSEAMRYSVFAGGKRLRPMLTLAAADAVARRRRVRADRRSLRATARCPAAPAPSS